MVGCNPSNRPYRSISIGSCSNPPFLIRTVLLAHVAVVPRRLAADNSSGMPQPREPRRPKRCAYQVSPYLTCDWYMDASYLGPAKCFRRKYCRMRPTAKNATATNAMAYRRRETLSKADSDGMVSMACLEWS
ncbi:hypothetical protein IG631_01761 [Alternaria alternata]|nr:hypothetical protein IG631_01761 [Alternaria alternata]